MHCHCSLHHCTVWEFWQYSFHKMKNEESCYDDTDDTLRISKLQMATVFENIGSLWNISVIFQIYEISFWFICYLNSYFPQLLLQKKRNVILEFFVKYILFWSISLESNLELKSINLVWDLCPNFEFWLKCGNKIIKLKYHDLLCVIYFAKKSWI